MKKNWIFIILLSCLLTSCKKIEVDTTVKLVTQEWLKGLETPWQIVFAPDGRIFFTERAGRVRVVKDGVLAT